MFARVGEAWYIRRNNGEEILLVLGQDGRGRAWFYPGTDRQYTGQDTVGLVRRAGIFDEVW